MSKKNQKERDKARHVRVYRFFRGLARRPFERKFNFTSDPIPDIDGNYLLLCNHNTDYDFIFAATHFKEHMYFVASEHVYRNKFSGGLLKYYFAPIARIKGTTASSTVMSVIRALRQGSNICIFAEGNRSFNGLTCPILFSTGKLAKASGASLVTYRLEGGYFSSPRWSYTLRRGKMHGEVVNVYSPERLREMSDDEINDAIVADLHEDAYARQLPDPVKFSGKKLAVGLEHALYICPECGRIGSMHSRGSKLVCECGMKVKYDPYGTLHGTKFDTITQWDAWQTQQLHELIDRAPDDEILFEDDSVRLHMIDDDHSGKEIACGKLSMDKASIRLGEHIFPLCELSGLAIYGRCTLVFKHDDKHYEINSDERLCSVKYLEAYNYLTK